MRNGKMTGDGVRWLNPVFFLLLILIAFSLTFKSHWLGDEGMILSASRRVLAGEVLYKDFFEFWSPLTVYLAAGLFKWLGLNLFWPRLVFFFSLILIILFTYLFTKTILSNLYLAWLPSALILISVSAAQIGYNHNWIALALSLVTVYLSLTIKIPLRWKMLVLGSLGGLTLAFIQSFGGALFLWLLLYWWYESDASNLGQRLTSLSCLGLGYACVWLPILFYFWQKAALGALFFASVYFPIFGYPQSNLAHVLNHLNLSYLILLLLYFLLFLKNQPVPSSERNCWRVALLFSLPALFTPGPAHSSLSLPFMLPLYLLTAQKIRPYLLHHHQFKSLKQRIGILLLAYVLIFYAADFVRRPLYNFWVVETALNTPIRSLYGRIYTYEWQASKVNEVLAFLQANTRSGEHVFAGPYSPIYYVLADIQNPTRYSQLTPGYNSDAMFQEALGDLERTKPRYILFFPSENPFEFSEDNSLSIYVLKNYRLIKEYPPVYRPENSPADGIYQRV